MKWKRFKYKFMINLIQMYGRTIGKTDKVLADDSKIKFEMDILKLLKKYDIINNQHKIQKVDISVEVDKNPKVKLETLILEDIKE